MSAGRGIAVTDGLETTAESRAMARRCSEAMSVSTHTLSDPILPGALLAGAGPSSHGSFLLATAGTTRKR